MELKIAYITCPQCKQTWIPRTSKPLRCPRCGFEGLFPRPTYPVEPMDVQMKRILERLERLEAQFLVYLESLRGKNPRMYLSLQEELRKKGVPP